MAEKKSFIIKIGGDSKKFNSAIRGVKRSLGKFKRDLSSVGSVAAGLGVSLSAAFITREAIRASDTYKELEGRLRLVTKSEKELRDVEQALFESAQRTRSEYKSTVTLYARVARNADVLGLSQQNLLDMTEATNQAILVSGATASEAKNGVIQFSQALASGTLRGDEFRSVMENMPRLALAIAAGLDTDIGKLREMSRQGKLTATVVTKALLSQADVLKAEFEQLPVTIGQSLTQLNNDFQRALAQADLSGFIEAITKLRDLVKDPAFAAGMVGLAEGVATFARVVAEGVSNTVDFARAMGEIAAGATGMGAFYDGITMSLEKYNEELKILEMQQKAVDDPNIPVSAESAKQIKDRTAFIKLQIESLKQQLKLDGQGGGGKPLKKPEKEKEQEEESKNILPVDTKAFDKALEQIQRQLIKTQELTEAEKVLWETQNGRYKDLTEQQKQALIAAAGEVDAARASIEAESERAAETKRLREEMEAAAEAVKNMVDPTRELNQQLEEQQRLRDAGLISWEQWAKATLLVRIQIEELGEKAGDTGKKMNQFTIQAARSMQSAFADFLFDPFEKGLKGMFDSFVDTVRRMAAEIVAQRALTALFPELAASVNHSGGVVGSGGRSRRVPMSAFVAAPRFHRGGLVGSNEVPAILQRGEEVLTANDPRHRKNLGGGVTVELVNNGTPQRVDSSDATFDVTGTVVRIVTDDLQRGGPIDSALTGTGRGRKI